MLFIQTKNRVSASRRCVYHQQQKANTHICLTEFVCAHMAHMCQPNNDDDDDNTRPKTRARAHANTLSRILSYICVFKYTNTLFKFVHNHVKRFSRRLALATRHVVVAFALNRQYIGTYRKLERPPPVPAQRRVGRQRSTRACVRTLVNIKSVVVTRYPIEYTRVVDGTSFSRHQQQQRNQTYIFGLNIYIYINDDHTISLR